MASGAIAPYLPFGIPVGTGSVGEEPTVRGMSRMTRTAEGGQSPTKLNAICDPVSENRFVSDFG